MTLLPFVLLAQTPSIDRLDAATDAKTIEVVTRELSSPRYEGRGTGQVGGLRAAEWIAARFRSEGLKPSGDRGGFLADTGIRSGAFEKMEVGFDGRPLTQGKEFRVFGFFISHVRKSTLKVDAPIVQLAIPARTLVASDLRGIDLKGKAILLRQSLQGVPLPKREAIDDEQTWEALRKAGAVVVVMAYRTPFSDSDGGSSSSPIGAFRGSRTVGLPYVEVTGEAGAALLDDRPATPPDGPVVAQATSHRIALDMRLRLGPSGMAPNVVGVLEGSDPKLRREAVVVMAHYDAFGKTPDGAIFPGASDNALGVGKLVAMAEAFRLAGVRPRRSVIFMATTGEEHYLLGATAWLQRPTWPLKNVVAAMNYDGYGTDAWGRMTLAYATGLSHSNLDAPMREEAKAAGLAFMEDTNVDMDVYRRSDAIAFARRGVPTVYAIGIDNPLTVAAKIPEYERTIYHQATDVVRDDWNWEGPRTLAGYYLRVLMRIANADGRPAWKPDSPFSKGR